MIRSRVMIRANAHSVLMLKTSKQHVNRNFASQLGIDKMVASDNTL